MEPSTTIHLRGALSAANLTVLHHQRELSIREIAAQLDVSIATVERALDHHNITRQQYPIENHKPHLADLLTKHTLTAALHDEHLTVAQIAARYDCSIQTIYTYLKTHDLELPDRPVRTQRPDTLTVETIQRLYTQQQLSLRTTANTIGVSDKTLRDFMDHHQIERRSNEHTLDTNQIAADYQSGATLKQLAHQHNCSIWAITKRLDDAGIPRRTGKRPKVA